MNSVIYCEPDKLQPETEATYRQYEAKNGWVLVPLPPAAIGLFRGSPAKRVSRSLIRASTPSRYSDSWAAPILMSAG
jgi:hypothetical protein